MGLYDNADTGGTMQTFSTGGGLNFPGLDGAGTFVADAYDSSLGFLSDGLNVWKDFLDIKGGSQVPASGSPDQFAERVPPVDSQAALSSVPAGTGQMIAGIPNGLLIAGGVLAAVMLLK